MSKHSEVIPLAGVERMTVVLGNGRLASKVKQDTGASIVINFGFFGGGRPTHHLKVDGTVLAKETWGCWGYSWDIGPDIKMEVMPAAERRNYVSGLEIISPMTREIGLQYDRDGELGGIRGRTALALSPGNLITYCSNDGMDAATLEGLQAELLGLGAESAVYGDGGGSSQGSGDGWEVKSSDIPPRAVYSYLCIWLKAQPKTLYKVQVGAFSIKSNAERLRDELAGKGYPGFIAEVTQ
ncbi:MAG TPA: SPOR domain-containing protein [Pseudoflavonifractor sp.]|nr:SPOR domain-containing protein [Pseudoflavonifractor sp.]